MRAPVMQYAAGNAYTASNSLGVRVPEMTMAEFQWCMIKARFPGLQRPIANVVHVPLQYARTRMAANGAAGKQAGHTLCAEFHSM